MSVSKSCNGKQNHNLDCQYNWKGESAEKCPVCAALAATVGENTVNQLMISHAIFQQHIPALNKEVATFNDKETGLNDIVKGLNKEVTDLKGANEKLKTSLNNNICEILEEQQPSVGIQ